MALRDIRAGEQLYLSYNECTDCMYERDYAYTYVLPYILRDYGFVEVRDIQHRCRGQSCCRASTQRALM